MKKAVRPGIYRITLKDKAGKAYEPERKFETYRTVIVHGKRAKLWECFASFQDAKDFKETRVETIEVGGMNLRAVWTHFQTHGMGEMEVSTRNKLRSQVRHLEPVMDAPLLKAWTPFTVDMLISEWRKPEYLLDQKGTRASYGNELALLKQLLGYYRTRFDFSFGQPVLPEHRKKSTVRKIAAKPEKDLSTREYGLFLAALEAITAGTEYEAIRVMAEVQYGLYARIQEIAALHYEDFDPKTGLVSLTKKIVWPRFKGQEAFLQIGLKASDQKRIKSPFIARLLQEWAMKNQIRSGPLFYFEGKPMPYRALQFRYDNAFKRAGMAHRGTHILRHAALTEHYETSGDIYETMHAAGHADVSTTQIYVKHRQKKIEATQLAMDSKLERVGK